MADVIPLGNEKILLVADDEILCHVTKVSLESFGYTVVPAGSEISSIDAQIDCLQSLADIPLYCMLWCRQQERKNGA